MTIQSQTFAEHRSGAAEVQAPVCHSCGEGKLVEFLDIGDTALANGLVASDELGTPDPQFPLRLGFCPNCSMVQLMDIVPPGMMFSNYLYVSSISATLRDHLTELADTMCRSLSLDSDSFVVDVGCNDGTLLAAFAAHGTKTLGVDPAANLAHLAAENGIEVKTAFFDPVVAREIRDIHGPADLVTATNVFQHIPDQDGFFTALDTLLADDGTFVFESHYLQDLLDQCAFDTIYHEHVFYLALTPLISVFSRHGFRVVDVERLPIHHGQMCVSVRRSSTAAPSSDQAERIQALLDAEREGGLHTLAPYLRFAEAANECRIELRRLVAELRDDGRSIAGYGAPAKASTLLAFSGLTKKELPYIVDLSPLKQGMFMPGSRIPVVPVDRIREDRPDYLIILAWNFADEIKSQLSWYRDAGGQLITPVPMPRIE